MIIVGKVAPLPFKHTDHISKGNLSRTEAAEQSLQNKGIEVKKFRSCEDARDEWCSGRCSGADLNSPECIDETCVSLRMTRHEALILSPCYRLLKEDLSLLEQQEFEGLPWLRVGILVAESELGLDWEHKEREVVII